MKEQTLAEVRFELADKAKRLRDLTAPRTRKTDVIKLDISILELECAKLGILESLLAREGARRFRMKDSLEGLVEGYNHAFQMKDDKMINVIVPEIKRLKKELVSADQVVYKLDETEPQVILMRSYEADINRLYGQKARLLHSMKQGERPLADNFYNPQVAL